MDAAPQRAPRPLGLLAELTHRCPLGCPYCSNPLALEGRTQELDTATWARVFKEAAALGVLQVHLSGGEPTARRDLDVLVERAAKAGLYTNLINSAVMLDEGRVAVLQHCDGAADVGAIAEILAAKYGAPRADVENDIVEMLQDLAEKGVIEDGRAG